MSEGAMDIGVAEAGGAVRGGSVLAEDKFTQNIRQAGCCRLCRNLIRKPLPLKTCIVIKYSFRIALAISAKAFHKIQNLYRKTLSQLYCDITCYYTPIFAARYLINI